MNNMNKKSILWAFAITIGFILYLKWEEVNRPVPVEPVAQSQANSSTANSGSQSDIPEIATANQQAEIPREASSSTDFITVNTDVMQLKINLRGGDIIEEKLLPYTVSVKDRTPIDLLEDRAGAAFIFQSGLIDKTAKTSAAHNEIFTSAQKEYTLNGDKLVVTLTLDKNGMLFKKIYTFEKGKYNFNVSQQVTNNTSSPWEGASYEHLVRQEVKAKGGFFGGLHTFTGAAYSTPEKNYEKLSFSDMRETNLQVDDVKGGWVSMIQHYFLVAIIPNKDSTDQFYTNELSKGDYKGALRIGIKSGFVSVAPGATQDFNVTVYAGPKIKDDLLALSPNLDKALDFGYLFFISNILFIILQWIESIIGNWGWSIVVTTLLIKACFFPLAAKSFKSMAKMRKFQPEMERMRKLYKDDRQKLGQETMKLYKKEGINPAAGCLPIIIQIPVFIGFYYMLQELVEMRQAPWIFWIHDLSIRDPLFILPVINGVLMFLQQKLNPPPADPTQRKVMMMLPIIFGVMFLFFPAGLVLYWSVSNLFSIIQQYTITKRYGGLSTH